MENEPYHDEVGSLQQNDCDSVLIDHMRFLAQRQENLLANCTSKTVAGATIKKRRKKEFQAQNVSDLVTQNTLGGEENAEPPRSDTEDTAHHGGSDKVL